MEKFRIAQYGFIQMVSLAYGILGSGVLVKISKRTYEGVHMPPPTIFTQMGLYRDYGIFLSVFILAWAAYCAFHNSIWSKKYFDESKIVSSGMILSGIFFVLGTYMVLGGIASVFPPASAYK